MHSSLTPQSVHPVQLLAPTTTNGAAASRAFSMKNALRAAIIVDLQQAVGHATTISLRKAKEIAKTNNAAGPNVPNWKNEDTAASDTTVKNADANSVQVAADVKQKQVIFQVEASKLDADYDCFYVTSDNSGQATNFMSVEAIVEPRYAGEDPPSYVVD